MGTTGTSAEQTSSSLPDEAEFDTVTGPDHPLCALPPEPPRIFDEPLDGSRTSAILESAKKWVNGTTLHYCFLSDPPYSKDKNVVSDAFDAWKEIPIGLNFEHVAQPADAEIRVSFQHGKGSYSYLGRDALTRPQTMETMNFGWALSGSDFGRDTALHEIGHAIGLPHEHQNPFAGIVWNEQAVLDYFAGPPNRWDEDKTRWNVLRKIDADTVQGSSWDADSIMHYNFQAGLIQQPTKYQQGLSPAPGLSDRDKTWAQKFYPPSPDEDLKKLKPFQAQSFELAPAEQVNLLIKPSATRSYQIGTFGSSDAVLVLFERVTDSKSGTKTSRFVAGDDDSGFARNALLRVRLVAGREYVVRLRLHWPGLSGKTAIMMW